MRKIGKLLMMLVLGFAGAICAGKVCLAANSVSATSGITLGTFTKNYSENIKLFGRTFVEGDYLRGEFCATGFDMNVTSTGGTLTLAVETNYENRLSILIDNEIVCKTIFPAKTGTEQTVSVPISSGTHMIRVIKQTSLSTSTTAHFYFRKLTFPGNILKAPANKKLLIECIGDSFTSGCGSDTYYQSGTADWVLKNHAVTSAYSYQIAEKLDADFMIVGIGGIGLDGGGSQEAASGLGTAPRLFHYNHYGDKATKTERDFSKERTPDMIIVELGPNDENTADNRATWGALAKEFILDLKDIYGADVPILWYMPATKSHLGAALADLQDDPDIASYGNVFLRYDYLLGNGAAARDVQYEGHPHELDEMEMADRIYNYLVTENMMGLKKEEPVPASEIVYYVAENGASGNTGLTPDSPLDTIPNVMKKFSDTTSYANGTVAHIYVSGTVLLGSNQIVATQANKQYKRADGSLLPFIFETYQYNGSNRATLNLTFKPSSDGNSAVGITFPATFKNVKIYATQQNNSTSVYKWFTGIVSVTFDNTTFGNALNKGWILSAFDFAYRSEYQADYVNNGKAGTSELILKNGHYDETTGVQDVRGLSVANLYLAAGSKASIPNITVRLVIDSGAIVKKAYAVTGTADVKEVIVELKTGGKIIGKYVGTTNGSSKANPLLLKEDITFFLNGGVFKGENAGDNFIMAGNNVTINGNLTFRSVGGTIWVPAGTSRTNNSIYLGGGCFNTVVNGDVTNDISGGSYYVMAGNVDDNPSESGYKAEANIYFGGGDGETIEGTLHNKITEGVFFICKQGTIATGSIFFGPVMNSLIKTEQINEIRSGYFDCTLMGGSIYASSEGLRNSVKKLTNIIGVSSDGNRTQGPKFRSQVLLGNGWGQYGRTGAYEDLDYTGSVSDDVVISNTIYGGIFCGNVYLSTSNARNVSSGYYPYVQGSVESVIYGGQFWGNVYAAGAAPVYGHVKLTILGGVFRNLYGTPNDKNAYIYDGLQMNLSGMKSYRPLLKHQVDAGTGTDPYTYFNTIWSGNVKATTQGRDAIRLVISDGEFGITSFGPRDKTNGIITGSQYYEVTKGYFVSIIEAPVTEFIGGGYFVNAPSETYLMEDCDLVPVGLQDYTVKVSGSEDLHKHCVCGGHDYGVGDHSCDASVKWIAWEGTNALPEGSGYYYLTADVNLTNHMIMKESQDLHLCLNGHTINGPKTTNKRVICITTTNASLTICDCSQDEHGAIVGNNTDDAISAGAIFSGSCTDCVFIFYSGQITGGTGLNGGNIALTGTRTTFKMYGGTISNGTATNSTDKAGNGGGNLYIGSSTTVGTIYGGVIKNGKGTREGGNIEVASGTLNIKGGTIEGGQGGFGGNIVNRATLNITGGTIKNGKSTSSHGGNMCAAAGTVTISDNARFEGGESKSYGGSISLTGGTLKLQGGTITGGKAGTSGGNIYAQTGTGHEIKGGTIENGEAETAWAGNIAVAGGSAISISGSQTLIRGGKAKTWGGNIGVDNGTLTLTDVTISSGQAGTLGGNLYFNSNAKSTTIKNTLITDGEALDRGGNIGVYTNTSGATITIGSGTVVTNGRAKAIGGNIVGIAGNIVINDGCEISKGNVTAGHGGNISTYGAAVTINGGLISEGNATTRGGNLSATGGSITINGGTIRDGVVEYNNTAGSGYGGNIAIWNNASLTINDGTITGGKGTFAGNLSIGECTFNMTGGLIAGGIRTSDQSESEIQFSFNNPTAKTYTISGGYIEGPIEFQDGIVRDVVISGGYYGYCPPADLIKDGMGSVEVTKEYQGYNFSYRVEKAYALVVFSADINDTSETGIAPITGGGIYGESETPTINALEVTGYHFLNWYKENASGVLEEIPGADKLTYELPSPLTEDSVYYALYEMDDSAVVVTISAPSFTYSLNEGDTWVNATGTVILMVVRGTKVQVSYVDEDHTFKAWLNGSRKVLSRTAESYTFLPVSTTHIEASYEMGDSEKQVVFLSASGQILSTVIGDSIDESDFPAAPARFGLQFTSWDKTCVEINSLLQTSDYVIVNPLYEENNEKCTIRLQAVKTEASDPKDYYMNQSTFIGSETVGNYDVIKPAEFSVDSEKEGATFIGAVLLDESNEEVEVISRSTNFILHEEGDVTVYLLYSDSPAVSEEPSMVLSVAKAIETEVGDYRFTFSVTRNVPSEYTVLEQGILFTTDLLTDDGPQVLSAKMNEESFYTRRYISTGIENNGVTALNINRVTDSDLCIYARGYLLYQDQSGTIHSLYTDLYYGSYTTGLQRYSDK